MRSQEKMRTGLKLRLASGFTTLLLVIAVACCLFFTLQSLSVGYVSLGGVSLFRVVTGSMEPAIPMGSILISDKADIEDISVYEIVCFRSKEQSIRGMIITHRVIAIYNTPDGSTVLQTQGDANLTPDVELVSQKELIGRVIWHTGDGSKMATVIKFLTSDFGFLACIILPAVLIAVWIFRDAVKSMKKAIADAKQQLEDWQGVSENNSESVISKEEYDAIYSKVAEEVRKELELDAEKSLDENEVQSAEVCEATETVEESAEAPADNIVDKNSDNGRESQ